MNFQQLTRRNVLIVCAVLVISAFVAHSLLSPKAPNWITETVTKGEVSNTVAVTGTIQAENTADLAFPTTGIASEIMVHDGDIVKTGQVLATLSQTELYAERADAIGALRIAEANQSEMIRGPRDEARHVTSITLQIAEKNLTQTIAEESEKVKNAYRTLLSHDLEALPKQKSNGDIPPTVSGTYTCSREGIYALKVFGSKSRSGYSYTLSGLETGTFSAYAESPAPLGTCGLMIQFDTDESYTDDEWTVSIPNTRSTEYVQNVNAYTLAKQQESNAVQTARQGLEKATREATLENATPREEATKRSDAGVLQAQARIAQVDARIADRTLRAPFDGVVSKVYIDIGETVGAEKAITIVANNLFELTVKIPEIDITKITVGKPAQVVFDARAEETLESTISFISPVATEIDGVAYFEAKLLFPNSPEWLRGGLKWSASSNGQFASAQSPFLTTNITPVSIV